MKAKFIRGDQWVAPNAYDALGKETVESMSTVIDGHRCWNVGAVLDNPQAYLLVRNGVATPEDDECRVRAGMDTEQLSVSQRRYQEMLDRVEDERVEIADENTIDEDDDE